METKLQDKLDGNAFSDYKIQINTIVDDCLKDTGDLKQKFPNNTFDEDYMLILRAFVPSLDIIIKDTKKKHNSKKLELLVIEEFPLESPQEITKDIYKKGKKTNYQNEIKLLKELREKGLVKDIQDKLINILISKGKLTSEEIKDHTTLNKKLSHQFLEWLSNPRDNVQSFIQEKYDKYENIFSQFEEKELNYQLKNILIKVFERRIQASKVKEYIQNNYKKYLSEFNNNKIKAKLCAIVELGETNNKNWLKDSLYSEYNTFKNKSNLFKELNSAERVILAEIVPKNLSTYHGEIGGKTIKLSSYQNINLEFNLTQAFELAKKYDDDKIFKTVRESLLKTIISRRYIFKEAIDTIINYREKQTNIPLDKFRNDNTFRELIYKEFFYDSKEILQKTHNLLNLKK